MRRHSMVITNLQRTSFGWVTKSCIAYGMDLGAGAQPHTVGRLPDDARFYCNNESHVRELP